MSIEHARQWFAISEIMLKSAVEEYIPGCSLTFFILNEISSTSAIRLRLSPELIFTVSMSCLVLSL